MHVVVVRVGEYGAKQVHCFGQLRLCRVLLTGCSLRRLRPVSGCDSDAGAFSTHSSELLATGRACGAARGSGASLSTSKMERTWRLYFTFTTGAPASARAGCFGSRKPLGVAAGLVAASAAAAESHRLCRRSGPTRGPRRRWRGPQWPPIWTPRLEWRSTSRSVYSIVRCL